MNIARKVIRKIVEDEYHVLNLGAGVQSTALYLLNMRRVVKPRFDYAIFADTREEPALVYSHLKWLISLDGPPILAYSWGHRLGDQLMKGQNSTGHRFVSIPAFTAEIEGKKKGIIRRQCTKEYKIEVVDRAIRREVLKLRPKQRIPSSVRVIQYFGISIDEVSRASKIYENWVTGKSPFEPKFPLVDMKWTRQDCKDWLAREGNIPHVVPRSACVFCPFKSNEEWRHLIETDPTAFARAVEIDNALRVPGNVCNRGMDDKMYVHSSCIPLVQIDFSSSPTETPYTFGHECEGMCGV
jgi:hypothetical protein